MSTSREFIHDQVDGIKLIIFINRQLNRFLYSAVSGLPDCFDLNEPSLKVLYDTFRMLNEQIELDATPDFLEELKSKICAGDTEVSHPCIASLTKIFQDKSLNPLNLPFEYLLNGTLPTEQLREVVEKPLIVKPSSSDVKAPAATMEKVKKEIRR